MRSRPAKRASRAIPFVQQQLAICEQQGDLYKRALCARLMQKTKNFVQDEGRTHLQPKSISQINFMALEKPHKFAR
jgi:hypothetical protein